MRRLEDALQTDASFDFALGKMGDVLMASLEATYAATGDIIDTGTEFDAGFAGLWDTSGYLAAALKYDYENLHDTQVAMYRGMCFGLQVVEEIRSTPISEVNLTSLIPEDGSTAEDEILRQASHYIAGRVHIDNLLGRFLPEIDPTFRYHHHIDIGATLVFMLCERQQAQDILEREVEALTPEKLTQSSAEEA